MPYLLFPRYNIEPLFRHCFTTIIFRYWILHSNNSQILQEVYRSGRWQMFNLIVNCPKSVMKPKVRILNHVHLENVWNQKVILEIGFGCLFAHNSQFNHFVRLRERAMRSYSWQLTSCLGTIALTESVPKQALILSFRILTWLSFVDFQFYVCMWMCRKLINTAIFIGIDISCKLRRYFHEWYDLLA